VPPAPSAPSVRRIGLALGPSASAVLFALTAIALWSTNALAGSAALERLPVGIVVLVQCATATVVLGGVRHVRRRRAAAPVALGRADRRYVLALGGLGFAGTLVLQYVSFANAPIVEANIIAYGWPMFAAVWLAGERRDRRGAAGLLFACMGFAGVGLIVGAGGGFSGSGNALGYTAALASALCMAFYSLGSGRRRVPALDAMVCGAVIGTLASAAIVLGGSPAWAPTWDWLGAAYIGLGPCAAGYAAWSAAMSRSGGRLAALGYATPLLSTIVLLAAGQPVSGSGAVIGGTLIVICTVGVVATAQLQAGSPSR
jgi:drug/metabolite transporter (DMT)-like permease